MEYWSCSCRICKPFIRQIGYIESRTAEHILDWGAKESQRSGGGLGAKPL